MQKPDEILELFKYIELNFDVNRLIYKGVRFWPMLRVELAHTLCLKNEPVNFKPSIYRPLNATAFLKLPFRLIKLAKLRTKLFKSIPKINADYIFCTNPNSLFIDQLQEKAYSRYIDPYYEVIVKHLNIERVNFEPNDNKLNPYHSINFANIKTYEEYFFLKNLIFPTQKTNKKEFDKLTNVFAELNGIIEKEYNIRPVFDGVVYKIQEYLKYDYYFKLFFNMNKNLKGVFLECFYNPLKMALVARARNIDVKVVEIQHGGAEDNVYLPYTNKQSDFKMIPDYIWCWSESDRELILKHNDGIPFLKPFCAGNMWLKKFINNEIKPSELEINFCKNLKPKKTILICLQTNIGLTSVMREVITKLSDQFMFLIRFHPNSSKEERNNVYEFILPFKNIETEYSSKINLYHLFKYVNFQITHSSTTAMESLSFKVATIICDPFGYDYYKDQINKNVLFYATTYEQIVNILENKQTLSFENVKHFLIKTDENDAIEKTKQILCAV